MKLSSLIAPIRISAMSPDNLMARIRELRNRRMKFIPPEPPARKTARKASTNKLEKLIAGMSPEERQALLAEMEKDA